jgi:hypothetical protein
MGALFSLLAFLFGKNGSSTCSLGWKQASLTYYESYPRCCDDPNYPDPTECEEFNGCAYQGDFAFISHQTLDWVKSHDICALFSTHGDIDSFANKKIRIDAQGKTVECTVYDTCSDADCGGCCTKNAGTSGYLLDMEYWTVLRHYGDVDKADGSACFQLA